MKQGFHQTEPRKGTHKATEREERCSHVTESVASVIQGAYYHFYQMESLHRESQPRNIDRNSTVTQLLFSYCGKY